MAKKNWLIVASLFTVALFAGVLLPVGIAPDVVTPEPTYTELVSFAVTGGGEGYTNLTNLAIEQDLYVGDEANIVSGLEVGGALTVTGGISTQAMSLKSIQFDTAEYSPTYSLGRMWWDSLDQTVAVDVNDGADRVTLQIGQEQHALFRNNTGSDIPNGTALFANGSLGQRVTASLSKADLITTSAVGGMATQLVVKNTQGVASTFGLVRGLNTSNWSEGDFLYLSPSVSGALTNTIPTSGYNVRVGVVLRSHPTDGAIIIDPRQSPYEGDIVGGNYTEWEYNGFMQAAGTARPWMDFNFGVGAVRLGATSPDLINIASTTIRALGYNGASTPEMVDVSVELNHDYAEGTTLKPHVHWGPTTNAAGNVTWWMEYVIIADDTVASTSTTISATVAAPETAWEFGFTALPDIPCPACVIGNQVAVRFYRDPTHSSDTYAADAATLTFGFHVQVDTLGSRGVGTK